MIFAQHLLGLPVQLIFAPKNPLGQPIPGADKSGQIAAVQLVRPKGKDPYFFFLVIVPGAGFVVARHDEVILPESAVTPATPWPGVDLTPGPEVKMPAIPLNPVNRVR